MSTGNTGIANELRGHGLRVTATRCAVIEWLFAHPHSTVEQVYTGVTRRLGVVSKQAVYDILSACEAADLVRRIKPAGHPALFERRVGDNHHHLVCRNCGRVADTGCRVEHTPCLQPMDDHGFEVDQAEVIFWGLCRDCRTRDGGGVEETARCIQPRTDGG